VQWRFCFHSHLCGLRNHFRLIGDACLTIDQHQNECPNLALAVAAIVAAGVAVLAFKNVSTPAITLLIAGMIGRGLGLPLRAGAARQHAPIVARRPFITI